MKWLTLDHFCSKRLCYAITSCDLISCYERVVHTAISLALLCLGIKTEKIFSMFYTIQHMIHRVRTAFGDSDKSYGGDDIVPG